jgi:hypothetical protein
MFDHRITRALAALVVAGALVSCAADAEPPASAKREGKGKAAHQKRADTRSGHSHGTAEPGPAQKQRGSRGGSRTSGAQAAGAASGTSVSASAAQGSGAAAQTVSKPSCRDDSRGDLDASGSPPPAADVTRGCLRADGQQLRLEASTAGPVPSRMPDRDTQLSYGFELTPTSGSTLYVNAQASPGGWVTYLSRGHSRREIGRPVIDGERVVLTLPLAELGGAQHVQWALESSWLRSGVLGTSYAFDSAPDIGTVSFDR